MIEAATPPGWQDEKDASFAGMDPYAIKALGLALLADTADRKVVLEPRLASITCPTTVIAGEHDHPLVDQAPELAGVGGRRPPHRDRGRVPLAAADPPRRSGRTRCERTWRGLDASGPGDDRRRAAAGDATASPSPAPTSRSRPSASARGPGATRASGAWAATTSRSPSRRSARPGTPASRPGSSSSTPPRSTATARASASSAGCWPRTPACGRGWSSPRSSCRAPGS